MTVTHIDAGGVQSKRRDAELTQGMRLARFIDAVSIVDPGKQSTKNAVLRVDLSVAVVVVPPKCGEAITCPTVGRFSEELRTFVDDSVAIDIDRQKCIVRAG